VDVKEIAVRRQKPPKKSTPVARRRRRRRRRQTRRRSHQCDWKRMSRSPPRNRPPAMSSRRGSATRKITGQQRESVEDRNRGSYALAKRCSCTDSRSRRIAYATTAQHHCACEHFDLPILIGHPHYKTRVLVSIWDTPGPTMYQTITRSPLSLATVCCLRSTPQREVVRRVVAVAEVHRTGQRTGASNARGDTADLYTTEVNNWCSHQLEGTSRDARCDGGFMKCSAMHDRST